MASRVAESMKQASREAIILLNAPALDRHLEAMAELADRIFCFYDVEGAGLQPKRRHPGGAGKPDHLGGLLMRGPWWDRRRPRAQRPAVNPRRQELEMAQEILAEVFGAQPFDLEERF